MPKPCGHQEACHERPKAARAPAEAAEPAAPVRAVPSCKAVSGVMTRALAGATRFAITLQFLESSCPESVTAEQTCLPTSADCQLRIHCRQAARGAGASAFHEASGSAACEPGAPTSIDRSRRIMTNTKLANACGARGFASALAHRGLRFVQPVLVYPKVTSSSRRIHSLRGFLDVPVVRLQALPAVPPPARPLASAEPNPMAERPWTRARAET